MANEETPNVPTNIPTPSGDTPPAPDTTASLVPPPSTPPEAVTIEVPEISTEMPKTSLIPPTPFAMPSIPETATPLPKPPTVPETKPGLGSLAGRLQSGGGQSAGSVIITPKPIASQKVPAPAPKNTSALLEELRKQSDEEDTLVRPLRTYKDDISDVMTKKKTSVVSAAAAEAERRQRKVEAHSERIVPKKSNANYVLIAGALFFLLIGIGIVGYALLFRNTTPGSISIDSLPKLVFSESQSTIETGGDTRRSFIAKLDEKRTTTNLKLGSITQYYPTTKSATGQTRILSASEFFDLVDITLPGTLSRMLTGPMMLGLHAFNGNQYFIVLKVSEYDRAFAGMLEWENRIEQDLFPVFGIAPLKNIPVPAPVAVPLPTSTATTTKPVIASSSPTTTEPVSSVTTDDFISRAFVDIVVKNTNARALKRSGGGTALLYAFPDKNTVVITTSEPTLTEIITRMQSIRI